MPKKMKLSFRLRLHEGLRQSGGVAGWMFGARAEALAYLRATATAYLEAEATAYLEGEARAYLKAIV